MYSGRSEVQTFQFGMTKRRTIPAARPCPLLEARPLARSDRIRRWKHDHLCQCIGADAARGVGVGHGGYTLAGRPDYLLRVVAPDLASLSGFMTDRILRILGVVNVTSTVTLRRIKQTGALPLNHVMRPTENRKRSKYTT